MSRSEPNFILMADDDKQSPVDELRRRALRLFKAADDDRAQGENRRTHLGFAAPAAMPRIEPAPARAFAVGVVTMPAVFIVVVMGALAMFGKPASQPQVKGLAAGVDTLEQPAARIATTATFASSQPRPSIVLGEDRRINSISLDGDRVALHVESPMGSEIVIYDYVEQRVVASAPIVAASLDVGDQLAMLTGPPPAAGLALIMPAGESVVETKRGETPFPPTIKPRVSE